MGNSSQPYTHNSVYYPGQSGLTEAEFRARRAAGAYPSGGAAAGQSSISNLGKQSTNLDYPAEQYNWTQTLPSIDTNLGNTFLAPGLSPNMAGKTSPFQFDYNSDPTGLMSKYNQFYGGPNGLEKGPQNAFNAQQLGGMHAMAIGQLQAANQNAMRGLAGSNSARGVVGNGPGAYLGQQLGIANAGALAQGDLAEQLQGLTQGTSMYNATANAAQSLGSFANDQMQRQNANQGLQFAANQHEKDNAFDQLKSAQDSLDRFRQQYPQQMFVTSGQGGGMGDQAKNYYRAMFDDLKRNYLVALQRYQAYA